MKTSTKYFNEEQKLQKASEHLRDELVNELKAHIREGRGEFIGVEILTKGGNPLFINRIRERDGELFITGLSSKWFETLQLINILKAIEEQYKTVNK